MKIQCVYSRTTSSYTSDQNHIPVLVIVHACGWHILFCRIANPSYPCSQAFAAFVHCRNAARVLTQPRPHICVLNQRDLKKKLKKTRWQSTASTRVTVAAAFFDALVAVAAFVISFSLRKIEEGRFDWRTKLLKLWYEGECAQPISPIPLPSPYLCL